MNRDRREIRTCAHEVRADPQGNGQLRFTGYAAIFNSWSQDLGGFREMIEPGAFARAVAEDDVRALFNHNPDYVLGRTRSGTLRLFEDENGLGFEINAPDTAWARDLHEMVQRGDVDQCSFGFLVRDEEWRSAESGPDERILKDVGLFDVSIVTYPAYEQTSVASRSAEAVWKEHRESREQHTRESGQINILRRKLDLREHGR